MEHAVILPLLLILPIVTWVDCSHEHDVSDVEATLMMTDEDTLTEIEKERLWKFQHRVASCIFGERSMPPLWPTPGFPFWWIHPFNWQNEDDAEYQYAGAEKGRIKCGRSF